MSCMLYRFPDTGGGKDGEEGEQEGEVFWKGYRRSLLEKSLLHWLKPWHC